MTVLRRVSAIVVIALLGIGAMAIGVFHWDASSASTAQGMPIHDPHDPCQNDQLGDGTCDEFGSAIAMAPLGGTAIIGAPNDPGQGADAPGFAAVFVRHGNSWSKPGNDLNEPGGASGDQFGYSVVISDDASLAVVGAPTATGGRGEVWTFVRHGDAWTREPGPLTDGSAHADEFGFAIALSGDGSTLIVGAPDAHGSLGAATLYTRRAHRWIPHGPPIIGPRGQALANLGGAVAVSNDGRTLAIGTPGNGNGASGARSANGMDPNGGDGPGSVVVLTTTATGYLHEAVIAPPPASDEAFGAALAFSANGTTLVVGAPGTPAGEVGGV
jgi:hypothetical protein